MRFRRWVVFTFLIHVLVVAVDKGAGLVLYVITRDVPQMHGAASLVASLPFILMSVANLGLATSLVYHVRRGLYSAQQAIETTLTVALVWGGTIGLAALVLTPWIAPLLRSEWGDISFWLILPLCLAVPVLLVQSYANSIQLASERIKSYGVVHLLGSLTFLPLFLAGWWLAGKDAPMGVAWGRLASALLVAVAACWMIRGLVRLRPGMNTAFLRDNVRYGWRANVTSVLTYLNHRVDLFVVGILYLPTAEQTWAFLQPQAVEALGPAVAMGGSPSAVELAGAAPVWLREAQRNAVLAQVGFYSMAVTFAEMVWHFPEAMRDLFFSKVAGSSHEEARRLTPVLTRLSALLSLIAGVLLLLIVDPVMTLVTSMLPGVGNAWLDNWSEPVSEAMMWLIPGTVCFTVAKVLQADLMARNLPTPCIRACWIVLVAMLALDVVLVPHGGPTGAAQASSIAYLLSSAYTLWVYRRNTGVPALECVLVRRRDFHYIREIVASVVTKVLRRSP